MPSSRRSSWPSSSRPETDDDGRGVPWWGAPSRSALGVGRWLLDEAPLDGPAAELVPVRELQLAEHRADVGLDGPRGDVELLGDLLVHVAPRDQPQDLALAHRQLIELRVDLGLGHRTGEGVE